MNQENVYIKHISLQKLWGKYDIDWELDPQVNILVGANGSGKSTLLQFLSFVLLDDERNHFRIMEKIMGNKFNGQMDIMFTNGINLRSHYSEPEPKLNSFIENSAVIDTFDSPVENVTKLSEHISPLTQSLGYLVYGNPDKNEKNSFIKYQLRAYEYLLNDKKEEGERLSKQIKLFYQIVNEFFKPTNKEIKFENQRLFFILKGERIELAALSAGEKQLLIMLLTTLFQEGKPALLLLDEPEISLHTRWQRILIDKILEINCNCQVIIATHSASVFGNGWMDKVKRMEDLLIS